MIWWYGDLEYGALDVLDDVFERFGTEDAEVVLRFARRGDEDDGLLSDPRGVLVDGLPELPQQPRLLPAPDRRVRFERVRPLAFLGRVDGRCCCHPHRTCSIHSSPRGKMLINQEEEEEEEETNRLLQVAL